MAVKYGPGRTLRIDSPLNAELYAELFAPAKRLPLLVALHISALKEAVRRADSLTWPHVGVVSR